MSYNITTLDDGFTIYACQSIGQWLKYLCRQRLAWNSCSALQTVNLFQRELFYSRANKRLGEITLDHNQMIKRLWSCSQPSKDRTMSFLLKRCGTNLDKNWWQSHSHNKQNQCLRCNSWMLTLVVVESHEKHNCKSQQSLECN
jgi:hypothetical protein